MQAGTSLLYAVRNTNMTSTGLINFDTCHSINTTEDRVLQYVLESLGKL